MFRLKSMQGVYSSGGSVANLLALGGRATARLRSHWPGPCCRRHAPASRALCEYGSPSHRPALGGRARRWPPCRALDPMRCPGRMRVDELERTLEQDARAGLLPLAIVANLGTTNRGAIDPLEALGEIANARGIWFPTLSICCFRYVAPERARPRSAQPAPASASDPRESESAQHHAREWSLGTSPLLRGRAQRTVTRPRPGRGRTAHRPRTFWLMESGERGST